MTGAPIKVLAIDDEPPIRKLLRMGLATQGYEILEAPSGKVALEKLAEGPALIILDLGLPDGDGLSVLRELRRRRIGQTQGALEVGQEGLFRPALGAVGVADAHGHLVGQLARFGALQAGHGIGQ